MKKLLFLFPAIFFFCSCYKDYSAEGRVTPITVSDTTLSDTSIFFDIIIDNKREFEIAGHNGAGSFVNNSLSYIPNDTVGVFEQGIDSKYRATFLTLFRGATRYLPGDTTMILKNQRKIAAFKPGIYPYTTQPYTFSGIMLHWKDRNGKTWGTDYGSGLQTSSDFRITDTAISAPFANGLIHSVRAYCTFNCTLYDNNGQKLVLTNGRMRIGTWF